MARASEEVGFDSIWLGDHLLYRGDGREDEGRGRSGRCLRRWRRSRSASGSGRWSPCLVPPAGVIAKMAATIDEVSGGRFVLGVGAGGNETEYRAFGLPYDHRVSRFEESFEIVRRTPCRRAGHVRGPLLAGGGRRRPAAAEAPIPLMIGSNGPRMLAATLPYVDAWNTWYDRYGNTVEGFAEVSAFVTEQAELAGRDPAGIYRSTAVLVELDADAAKRPHSDIRKRSERVAPADLRAHLDALERAGADEAILILRPITEESIRAIAGLGL